MPWESWEARPSWWEDWVPSGCPVCKQPWLPGRVTHGWTACQCPAASADAPRGHASWRCAIGDCRGEVFPPGHVEAAPEERPRSY